MGRKVKRRSFVNVFVSVWLTIGILLVCAWMLAQTHGSAVSAVQP